MSDLKRMGRREAMKWMLTASAGISVLGPNNLRAASPATGYGTDPNLIDPYKIGDLWPLTFTPEQRRLAATLCDVILPADEKSRAASALLVHDFIDEWISAPYPKHQTHKKEILEGFDWLDAESQKRFQRKFVDLAGVEKHRICDDICNPATASKHFERPARFFSRFRDLAMSGFYTTPEGMKDVGYTGNVPLQKFDGPPKAVLSHLKLDEQN
jgi:hypothetical protein